jgi:hypothetical protein
MSHSVSILVVVLLTNCLSIACSFAADDDGPLLAPPWDDTVAAPAHDSPPDSQPVASGLPAWSTLLRDLVDETIPRDYEKRDGWGRETEIVTGVRVRQKNGLPRLSKRTKRVNHGVWKRYRIALINPEEKLKFTLHDVQPAEDAGLTFKVVVSARVRCTAQSEFWNFGIQTGSATVQADATVRAIAKFVVRSRDLGPDDDSWFTEIEYTLEADRVRIELDDFDVRRVGKLDGDLADGLGNTAQALLGEVLHGQEEKVTRRIRRELAERDARFKVTLPRVLVGANPQSEQVRLRLK